MSDRPVPSRVLEPEALWQALVQQRRIFGLFFGAVMLAAIVVTALTKREFEAVAVIQLLPRAGTEVQVDQLVKSEGGYMEARERARTQIQIIYSRTIREEVVKRYNALGHNDIQATTAGLEGLRSSMRVTPREDTQLVEVAVLNGDAARAAILANLLTEVYSEANLSSRTTVARDTLEWIDGESGAYKQALDDATAKVLAFKAQHNLADIDEAGSGIGNRLAALETALSTATTERVLLEGRLAEHRRLASEGKFDVLAGMFADPALDTMARERAAIMTESADVLSRYGAQHPDHQRAMERIKRVDLVIAEEVRRNIDGEASQVAALRRQEARIEGELAAAKTGLLGEDTLRAEYSKLKQEEDRARALFGSLGDRGAEVDLQARTRLSDVRIVDRAVPPSRPAKPNWKLNLGMAVFVGIGGGLGIVFMRYRVTEMLMTRGDVERAIDAPLLGVIPSLPTDKKIEKPALYTFDHPRSMIAEAFRAVRTVLQTEPFQTPSRRYIVTSCLESEGKSLAAVGLATTFAQLGLRVLLIDCDLRLPKLHVAFGMPRSPGLADALVEDRALELVERTHVPRLHLLRCGSPVEYPNEFVASPELESLLDEASKAYEVVIIDTPPVALVADALALAPKADGVIMVFRRGRVARELAIRTMTNIRQTGAKVLGVLLNDVPRAGNEPGYGSRYYDDRTRNDGLPAE